MEATEERSDNFLIKFLRVWNVKRNLCWVLKMRMQIVTFGFLSLFKILYIFSVMAFVTHSVFVLFGVWICFANSIWGLEFCMMRTRERMLGFNFFITIPKMLPLPCLLITNDCYFILNLGTFFWVPYLYVWYIKFIMKYNEEHVLPYCLQPDNEWFEIRSEKFLLFKKIIPYFIISIFCLILVINVFEK